MIPMRSPRPSSRPIALPSAGNAALAGAPLLWLPQAALLALAVQGIADGRGFDAAWQPALGIVVLGLTRVLCEAWGARRVFAMARARLSMLRAQAVAVLAAGAPFDSRRPASGLVASVLAEQAEALVPYLVRYQPARLRVMVVPLVILLVVASQSWLAALVLLFSAPVIPLFMAIIGWRARAASEAQMVEMGSMNAFLLDRLRGLATLRAFGAVDATALRLDASAQSLRQRTMAVLRIAFLSSAVLELFSALGVAMVAAYVGFHLLGTLGFGAWGQRLSLGQGMFVLLLAPAFFEPLRELSAAWHDRAAGQAALQALEQLGRAVPPMPGRDAAQGAQAANESSRTAPSIGVRNLHFAHAGEAPLFEGFDLRVGAGEHIALMGDSGAGKTALLSLLAGLQTATSGDIVIGGITLNNRTAAVLRQRIGWMGQRPHVFAGSVEANVALGRAEADTRHVEAAMRFAELADVAQAHPRSMLGEGGNGLSGGEAVRLALARLALHRDADLLLVDEPTAHLDTDTARRVTDALLRLARGKTLIVATHDPVLAARMHRVVSLDPLQQREAA
ncbi:thiol reductant ABC exporter subunit CydD [Variovorax sp. PAMC 28711]|uniref:thiol reductant ABC exporter subunit CydD n=1 Tax=Variovorax sp. PAMC 28711 TaxID=1795631 RepID=UPI00078B6068|nr:ABC transporter ATP-binding protein [Variovorax sp. PAMC 28711]